LMKQLKDEIKELQVKVKTMKDQPEKMMALNKKMMQTNMKYMMQSFKATFFTFLPIIIFYAYLNGVMAYDPLMAQQDFNIEITFDVGESGDMATSVPEGLNVVGNNTQTIADNKALFTYKGDPGRYLVQFAYEDTTYGHEVLISNQRKYLPPEALFDDGKVTSINTLMVKTIALDLFGWQLGWFGAYIIWSIVFSMLLRKLLRVY